MDDNSREVYRAIDLALRVGEVVLSSGAGAADVSIYRGLFPAAHRPRRQRVSSPC